MGHSPPPEGDDNTFYNAGSLLSDNPCQTEVETTCDRGYETETELTDADIELSEGGPAGKGAAKFLSDAFSLTNCDHYPYFSHRFHFLQ